MDSRRGEISYFLHRGDPDRGGEERWRAEVAWERPGLWRRGDLGFGTWSVRPQPRSSRAGRLPGFLGNASSLQALGAGSDLQAADPKSVQREGSGWNRS